MYIWKRTYNPFLMGGKINKNIKTEVDDYEVIDLGKGFKGIYIERSGVFELESGGLVGDTIQQVRNDISDCNDVMLMRNQIDKTKLERENAIIVTNEEFLNRMKCTFKLEEIRK